MSSYERVLLESLRDNFLRTILMSLINELRLNKISHIKANPTLDFIIIRNDTFIELKMMNEYLIKVITIQEESKYKPSKEEKYLKIRIN